VQDLASVAESLRTSQAVEQLHAMGVTLTNAINTLQVVFLSSFSV
jgi:phage terminase large subunit-like protein